MSCCRECWITIASVSGGLAVILGALEAHGLDDHFARLYNDAPPKVVVGVEIPAAQKYLGDFKTAAEYQMYHSLALLAVGLLLRQKSCPSLSVAAISFTLGILLFSGSLYVLALTGERWLGMITPFGGVAFIVGWVALAAGCCPCRNRHPNCKNPHRENATASAS